LVICPFGLTEPERIAEENVMLEALPVLTPGAEAARAVVGAASAPAMRGRVTIRASRRSRLRTAGGHDSGLIRVIYPFGRKSRACVAQSPMTSPRIAATRSSTLAKTIPTVSHISRFCVLSSNWAVVSR
jgi:hypothetical protein